MAQDETKRVRREVLAADTFALEGVRTFTDYQPLNPAYTLTALNEADQRLKAAERAYIHAKQALAEANNNLIAAQWARHNAILGMREQVIAQYGRNSNHIEKVGLKRKVEYD